MITLFRNNHPIALILLVPLALLSFWNFSSQPIPSPALPTSMLHNELGDLLDFIDTNSIWGIFLKLLLLLSMALYLNKLVTDNKLMDRSGYVPAMTFLVFSALLPNSLSILTLLINGLVLVAIRLLIQVYKQDRPNNNLVSTGFCMGLVTGLIAAHLMFYVWMVIAILIMRPSSIREWLIATIGFLLPFYFLASIQYLNDKLDLAALLPELHITWKLPELSKSAILNNALIVFLPIIGMMAFNQQMNKMVILGRKSYLIVFVLYLALLVAMGTDPEHVQALTGLALIPAAFLFAPFFMVFRREFIPNLVALSLLALSLFR